jgi:hypothetical protein
MYEDKPIPIAMKTKFLRLFINNNLSWKTHNEYMKSKLSSTCYAMWSIKPNVSLNTLKTIYCSSFHSVMSYGLLFWGHSSDSRKIFRLRKKIIRIMMHCRSSNSGRNLFFNLEILPLPSQYILSFLLRVMKNRNQFMVNSEIYNIDKRHHANFHQPSANLNKY